jgi:hypothetical protein
MKYMSLGFAINRAIDAAKRHVGFIRPAPGFEQHGAAATATEATPRAG